MNRNIDTELEALRKMLALYCRGRHGGRALCPGCRELAAAAERGLRGCRRSPKPACKDCPASCYPPGVRAGLREVMRYAGPRMPLRHPLLALRHYLGF